MPEPRLATMSTRDRPGQSGTNIGRVTMTLLTSQTSARDTEADAIIVGVVQGSGGALPAPGAEDVDAALDDSLAATLSVLGATGKAEEVTKIATAGRLAAPLIVAVGLGAANGKPPFAAEAERVAAASGLDVEVLEEKALADDGYGGILGVGQGSVHSPRLVRLAYSHPDAAKTVVLAGKGITFDSGGLSLKPAKGMEAMKSDMGGAAAVLAAMQAIAALGPVVNVVGYLPLAENMPSGTAQRPSDVITIFGGTTVEVLNTDAEGRLVLADALARSAADEPDLLVDV